MQVSWREKKERGGLQGRMVFSMPAERGRDGQVELLSGPRWKDPCPYSVGDAANEE